MSITQEWPGTRAGRPQDESTLETHSVGMGFGSDRVEAKVGR